MALLEELKKMPSFKGVNNEAELLAKAQQLENQATKAEALEKANKASLVFSLPHEEGSLSQVLSILSFYKINLTKIQSLPVIGHEWEYLFYVDVTYNSLTRYRQAVDAIMPLTKELTVLGEYREN